MKRAATTVIKAGGSLLESGESLERIASVVGSRRRGGERIVLVVSALAGATDRLESELWRSAAGYPGAGYGRAVEALAARHAELAAAIPGGRAAVTAIERQAGELSELVDAPPVALLERPRQARLLTYGERMSAVLVAAALRAAGADARAVTAEEAGLVALGPTRAGSSDLAASRPGTAALLPELDDRVLVVTGFYGVRESGEVVLFGRGGSDYTAGVMTALSGARRLEFWKDLPGYFTANPKRVPEAERVPELTFEEASLLGLHGARILHPRCLDPIWDAAVSVAVGLPDDPAGGSRLVLRRPPSRPRVRAIAVRAPRTVVRASLRRPGVDLAAIGRRLAELEAARFALDGVMISGAGLGFSVADDRPYDVSRSLAALNGTGQPGIAVRHLPAWVGLVGENLAADPEIVAAVDAERRAAGVGRRAAAVALGDSALRCRVERAELEPLLAALHRRFFG